MAAKRKLSWKENFLYNLDFEDCTVFAALYLLVTIVFKFTDFGAEEKKNLPTQVMGFQIR